MNTTATFVLPECLPARINRRKYQRFSLCRDVHVVVHDDQSGSLSPQCVHAVTANLSPAGALIILDDALPMGRVWIKTEELRAQGRLVECEIVREADVPPKFQHVGSKAYGVRFVGIISAVDLANRLVMQGSAINQ